MLSKKTSGTLSPTSSVSSSTSRSRSPPDWDADDEFERGNMSGEEHTSLRPKPISVPPRHAPTCASQSHTKRPTLRDILSNASPPPWTLTAFMAYLSNNHCLETLEFTMDATRYKKHYHKVVGKNTPAPQTKEVANMRVLWQRLIEAYIRPNGSREINIPSEVRDPILNYDCSINPPPPEALDIAVAKVYELMEESVLVPFLNSMSPHAANSPTPSACDCGESDTMSPGSAFSPLSSAFRSGRFGHHSPPQISPTSDNPLLSLPSPTIPHSRITSPMSLTNALHRNRPSTKISPTSSGSNAGVTSAGTADAAAAPGLTDDSGYTSSHTNESVTTPPMSPPDDGSALSPLSPTHSSRESGTWKKFGRLSGWKPMRKKSQNFKETESMP